MKIKIEDLKFYTIIGILDFERIKEQKVIIEIEIDYKYMNQDIIDYSEIVNFIEADMKNSKYFLIEEALQSIIFKIKNKFQNINSIYVKISKPDILDNCIVSVSQISK